MTEREMIIKLLEDAEDFADTKCPSPYFCYSDCTYRNEEHCYSAVKADYLIKRGVTIEECEQK